MTQLFHNATDNTISEATYAFPLYDTSTVVSCNCRVGNDTEILGVVKEKTEARATYDKAIAKGRMATHMVETTPEIFEFGIARIPPKTRVSVEIVFLNELKPDLSGNGFLYTLPTSNRSALRPCPVLFQRIPCCQGGQARWQRPTSSG